MSDWHFGNANDDSQDHRGWFVGHFMPEGDLRHSEEFEIKWGVHPAGETRASWQGDEYHTTVVILVKGRHRIELSTGTVVLEREGDYAMWGPGVGHSWTAEEDSVVITVRSPSAK